MIATWGVGGLWGVMNITLLGGRRGTGKQSGASSKDMNNLTQMKILIAATPPTPAGVFHERPAVHIGIMCTSYVEGRWCEVSMEGEWDQCPQDSS